MAASKTPKLKTYKEIPIGGMIEKAGSSADFKTGDWKAFRPVWDNSKCIHCMICPVLCPENCIPVKKGSKPADSKRSETDFDYCKGCGICAQVCPVKCIKMIKEGESENNADESNKTNNQKCASKKGDSDE
ncbi:MAG: 4Fe-4S dicluster domain-containing protein [Candidatus Woesearchaeota archaeon]